MRLAREAILPVRERRQLVLPREVFECIVPEDAPLALIAAQGKLGFRATAAPLDDEGAPLVSKQCREALGVAGGDRVHVTPLP